MKPVLVRTLAAVVALALAALAAWLWLRPATDGRPAIEGAAAGEAAEDLGPPPHGEIDAEDRAALRELLREDAPAPGPEAP